MALRNVAMLDGLKVIFLEALSFLSFEDNITIKILIDRWNKECEEVYKYKQELIAEEREKHKTEIETMKDTIEHLAVFLKDAKADAAREIFDELDVVLSDRGLTFADWCEIKEFQKKFTGGDK